MSSNPYNFVIVAGYGWSGSGAVVDLLKEFDGYKDAGTEFRTIKEPYGIIDLESSLLENWDVGKSDIAIKDFLWLVNIQNRNQARFSNVGSSYEALISEEFLTHTKKYIENLISFDYSGHWFFLDYKMSHMQYIFKKIKNRLGILNENSTMYFSKPSKEEFYRETKKYLYRVFEPISHKEKAKTIILDQAIPAHNPYKAFDYFHSAKVIIVDRDPRDIYIDLINCKVGIGRYLYDSRDVEKYISYHEARRSGEKSNISDPRILRITLEELVIDYDESVKKILNFLGEDQSIHRDIKKHFNPEYSKKNVGLWKEYSNQHEVSVIYEKLKDYCYQG
jgi:hypothetical protein